MDSCLTYSEGSQREQYTHNKGSSFRSYNGTQFLVSKEGAQEPMLLKSDLTLYDHLQEKVVFLSPSKDDAEKRNSKLISMNVGLEGGEGFGRPPVLKEDLKEESLLRKERTENENFKSRT